MMPKLLPALVLLLTSLGLAQKTITVDGSGHGDFTDLPAAMAKAQDGDRIVIRKGVYSPAATSKALVILGDAGAVIRATKSLPRFEVHGLAKHKAFVMRGVHFDLEPYSVFGTVPAPFYVHDCAGRVHLEAVTGALSHTPATYTLEINNVAAITLAGCAMQPGLTAYRAHVAATGCLLLGLDGPPYRMTSGSYAIDAHTATVELSQVVARGGSGSGHSPSFNAVRVNQSTLIVRGDSNSRYESGQHSLGRAQALYGSTTSTLVLDPSVTLVNGYIAFSHVTTRRMPSLTGAGGTLGGHTSLDLFSENGNAYALFAALPMHPLAIPGLGQSWLDGPTLLFLQSGTVGSSEHVKAATFVPKHPAFLGLAVAFQAIQVHGHNGFEISNPLVTVMH